MLARLRASTNLWQARGRDEPFDSSPLRFIVSGLAPRADRRLEIPLLLSPMWPALEKGSRYVPRFLPRRTPSGGRFRRPPAPFSRVLSVPTRATPAPLVIVDP